MRVDPTPAIADLVYARADANTTLPVRELMWGMPGSMIACCHMAGMTAEPRWRALFAIQAIALMRGWEWLTDDQRARIAEAVPRTLAANAWRSELAASWRGVVADRDKPPRGPRQLQQRPRAALPALSRSSWDGDGIRGCAVHVG
jgi:hypothetical protein